MRHKEAVVILEHVLGIDATNLAALAGLARALLPCDARVASKLAATLSKSASSWRRMPSRRWIRRRASARCSTPPRWGIRVGAMRAYEQLASSSIAHNRQALAELARLGEKVQDWVAAA